MSIQQKHSLNPFSSDFYAWGESFNKIPSKFERFKIIFFTALKIVITFGFGMKSAFRKYTAESLNSANAKAAAVASKAMGGVVPENKKETSFETEIRLSNKNLTQVPPDLKGNEKVEKIDFGYNQLQVLPEWFTKLSALKNIDLYDNKLKSLPDTIGALDKLIRLAVDCNELKQLPESVCNLTSLQELLLSGNQLQELPNNIGNLTKLVILELQENPLTVFPDLSAMESIERLIIDLRQAKEFEGKIKEFRDQHKNCIIVVCDKDAKNSREKIFYEGDPFSFEAVQKEMK